MIEVIIALIALGFGLILVSHIAYTDNIITNDWVACSQGIGLILLLSAFILSIIS